MSAASDPPGFVAVLFAPRPDWYDDALCHGLDAELFHPGRGDPVQQVKAVCSECPVREQCLDYALETRQKFGIWGGKSERERRDIRHRRKLAAAS
ncbi:MAG TPA: WhiB family transcriptional regulator [Acidimicrobiales bacterium]|nr:WhiB family transcriptional regulator [Acidimicrobiales bacterium]